MPLLLLQTTEMANKDLDKYYNALDKYACAYDSNMSLGLKAGFYTGCLVLDVVLQGFDEVPCHEDGGDQQDHQRALAANIQGPGYRLHRDTVRFRRFGDQVIQLQG